MSEKKNVIDDIVQRRGIAYLDGGFATELERQGCDLNDSLWSARILLDNPSIIKETHLQYFKAGADIAISSSYQASYEGLAAIGYSHDEATRVMVRSVDLARQAVETFWSEHCGGTKDNCGRIEGDRSKPLVAGSVGSYGAFLADGSEYKGNYKVSVDELIEWHRPRLETLLSASPDLLACETIPCIDEAVALMKLLSTTSTSVPPAYLSFSIASASHLCSGELLADCVRTIEGNAPECIVGIGINCSDPRFISAALQHIRPLTKRHLIVYPNRGEAWDHDEFEWKGGTGMADSEFSELALEWYEMGARVIGGCCRTTPCTVAAVQRNISSHLVDMKTKQQQD